jgi:hypothetical protein
VKKELIMIKKPSWTYPLWIIGLLVANPVMAQTSAETLASIKQSAAAMPEFQGFSAARGEQFFKSTHGNDWSCSTCHTNNPAENGKHAKTGKLIKPMAPATNLDRFTDAAKVDKWFKRNCNDVLGRACTPQEKGDVLTYLMTLR